MTFGPKTTRRTFLRATLVSAGAVLAGACGDDDGTTPRADAGTDTGTDAGADGGFDTGADAGPDATDASPDAGDEILLEGAAFYPQSVASGDPRADGVVLWTRVLDPAAGGDLEVELHLALDEAFEQRVSLDGAAGIALVAAASADHCVKALVVGLESATTYWYRFVYRNADGAWASRTGRTRTAPAPDDDRAIRFAFVSCQDITGTYFNPYKRLLADELDVIVHLGDYVYETTGDPSFQEGGSDRTVIFGDLDGALELGEGDDVFWAARSLDNYRDLYRTYRGDSVLQRVHERFPMIVIWDDHEFSDDCWQDVATYSDGELDERDTERRMAANRAWFEYMPMAHPDDGGVTYDDTAAFPNDLRIYRDLRFGRHAHFVMTDLRTYRPDHVIGEDELPGHIAVTEPRLIEAHGGVPEQAGAYVDDIATFDGGTYLGVVQQWVADNVLPADRASGPVSIAFIRKAIDDTGANLAYPDDAVVATLPRGIAIADAGKRSAASSIGSRYLATRWAYDLIAAERYEQSGGASEDILGPAQKSWFLDTMRGSDATWKVWGNEFCHFPKIVDVSSFPTLPPEFKQTFYLSVEDWPGCMNERDALIESLADVSGVVAVTGDIHAFFASSPTSRANPDARIVEFVTGAISSGTYERLLVNTANGDPALREAGAAAVALLVPDLLTDRDARSNPELAFARIDEHGYASVELDVDAFTVTFRSWPQNLARQDAPEADMLDDSTARITRLQVRTGSADVYMERDGAWQRWDADTMTWQDA